MSQFADDLKAAEQEMEDMTGEAQTVRWNGTDYSALIGDLTSGKDLNMVGYIEDADGQILIRTELFTSSLPANGDTFSHITGHPGKTFRIKNVQPSRMGHALLLDIKEKDA